MVCILNIDTIFASMRALTKLWHKKEICHPVLAILLCFVLVLRIPNFFEPYWYGDEGIYLTIGNGIRVGDRLYVDIVDHKTPLIYYFASVGSQLNFRILLVTWMLLTTIAFYRLSERLFKNKYSTFLATFAFVLSTTLPLFEGNIPNGELFVMGFVLFGFWILSYSSYFASFVTQPDEKKHHSDWQIITVSGILFGLGILTKVPGLLDACAAFMIGWFGTLQNLKTHTLQSTIKKLLPKTLLHMLILAGGIALPILISVVYYVLRGSGEAYLNFGLLYNLHYSGNWDLGFTNPLLAFSFTLVGKFLFVVAGVLALSLLTKFFTPQQQFIATWTLFALFASLLSNRPYPHYYLQIFPPLALLLGYGLEKLNKQLRIFQYASIALIAVMVFAVMKILHVGGYPVISYYQRNLKLLTGQMSYHDYRNSFEWIMEDNYKAAEIISRSHDKYMFIWGTNPTLYALTKKQPTGRFTVSFHIIDLKVYDETFKSIVDKKPEYIVVMNNETAELPGLRAYLRDNYIANNSFEHFVLWRKRSTSSL